MYCEENVLKDKRITYTRKVQCTQFVNARDIFGSREDIHVWTRKRIVHTKTRKPSELSE